MSSCVETIPTIREIELHKGEFVINHRTVLLLSKDSSDADRFSAGLLRQEIERIAQFSLQVEMSEVLVGHENIIALASPRRDRGTPKNLELSEKLADEESRREGYVLEVKTDQIVIAADTEAGLFYGVQTLRQLLKRKGNEVVISCLSATDWPEIRYRGVMQDISRGQVLTIDSLKELIRVLSYFKTNVLSLYIEHTFTFEKHPLIGKGCGSLTKKEVKELDEYAKKHHIELIPSIQALGHFYQILKHKEYAHLAETPDKWSLSPADERTYELLGDMLSEIATTFSSRFINVGCDEVVDLGSGKSKKMVTKLGKPGLYLSHLRRVKQILDKHGKTLMLWGDMLLHYPEIIPALPKDVMVMNWTYGTGESETSILYRLRIQPFKKSGLEQFVCPGICSWRRLFPYTQWANRNIQCFVSEGKQFGAKGVLTTNWGDDGNHNLLGYAWYGFALSAELSWVSGEFEEESFDKRFGAQFFGRETESIAQAIWLLSQSNSAAQFTIPGRSRCSVFGLMWDDPFEGQCSINIRNPLETGRKLATISGSALEIIERVRSKATRNKKWFDDLIFAAREIGFLGRRVLLTERMKDLYKTAYLRLEDEKEVIGCLATILGTLKQLRRELSQLSQQYQELWLRENRRPGLDYNLDRYARITESFDKKVVEIREMEKNYRRPGVHFQNQSEYSLRKK